MSESARSWTGVTAAPRAIESTEVDPANVTISASAT
jgi:hypothetical protein